MRDNSMVAMLLLFKRIIRTKLMDENLHLDRSRDLLKQRHLSTDSGGQQFTDFHSSSKTFFILSSLPTGTP